MANNSVTTENSPKTLLIRSLEEHLAAIQALLNSKLGEIESAGRLIGDALGAGKKILLCGNGGSAADADS